MRRFVLQVIIVVFCGFLPGNLFAREKSAADSVLIKNMIDRLLFLEDSNLRAALEYSRFVGQKASEMKYLPGIWEAKIEQGIIVGSLGFRDSALMIINQTLKEVQEKNDRLSQVKAHLGLALVYKENSGFESAINELMQAEKIITANDPFAVRYRLLISYGSVHRMMKDYLNAERYYNSIESELAGQLTPKQRFVLLMNKGNVFAEQEKYDEAESQYKSAYGIIKNENSPINQALITYNLGALLYKKGKLDESREYIMRSLEANQKIGDRLKIERCYRVLGGISFSRKNYEQAKSYHLQALSIANEIRNPRSIMACYDNLYQTYWNLGYYNKNIEYLDKAIDYYRRAKELKDSLYNIETAAKVLELEKRFETEKKNQQITLLEKENQHQLDQIQLQNTQRNYLIFIVVFVLVVLVVFIYFFFYTRRLNRVLKVQSQDISEQKHRIEIQNEALQKSVNTQNKLFSIIGHDLRSPLASIINISSLIGIYLQDKDYMSLGKMAQLMEQKTDQVLELTDNLLNWARSQSKSLDPLMAPVSMHEIFDECLDLYRPIALEKYIAIDCLKYQDAVVWADRNMLKTICRNLVNNAIKFTHKKGNIKVWLELTDELAQVSVKDSGIGIDPQKIPTLFRVNPETITPGTADERSTGLGLSVCREFIEAMKGRIWVESSMGQGSQFTFELQVYNPEIHKIRHQQPQANTTS